MDRIRAMESFVHVVELAGFAAAGRQLELPRAAVSKHVQQLEDHYQVRLLHRTTRRVALTEAGERLYPHCRAVLATLHDAEATLAPQRARPAGRLRVAAPVAFTDQYLGELLARFVQRHPEVTLDLACSDRFVDLIDEGFDVAVRIAALPPSSLVARRLASSPVAIVGAPAYLARCGRPRRVTDLRRHTCLGYAYQAIPDRWTVGAARIPSRHRVNSNAVLRALAIDGHGLAQLPLYLIAADLAAGRLVKLLRDDDSRSVYVVYPHRRHLPPKVRAFTELLVEAFASRTPW